MRVVVRLYEKYELDCLNNTLHSFQKLLIKRRLLWQKLLFNIMAWMIAKIKIHYILLIKNCGNNFVVLEGLFRTCYNKTSVSAACYP